jgi:1,4-dihydroxy-2-naphthoyl-CoA hydrolase
MSAFPTTPAGLNQLGADMLPGVLGVEFTRAEPGLVEARLTLDRRHLAPNGYLHAASIVALADTACGYGCMASLPPGGDGFTTIELKSNFIGTQTEGSIACRASLVHGGRTTQIWDAVVTNETTGRTLALFRCTQLILRREPTSPSP